MYAGITQPNEGLNGKRKKERKKGLIREEKNKEEEAEREEEKRKYGQLILTDFETLLTES